MNVLEARQAAEEHGFVVVTTVVNTTFGTHRQPLRLRFRNTLQPGIRVPIEEFRRWAGEQVDEPSGLEMEPGDEQHLS